jgi:hypothetical protein
MFGSVVIDVVIALALVFTVFSLVTSGLRELIARVVSTRSKELWRSIRMLLEDPISNALRCLREWNDAAGDAAEAHRAKALTAAERRLRSARDASTEEHAWLDEVDQTMKELAEAFPRAQAHEPAETGEPSPNNCEEPAPKLIEVATAELRAMYRADEGKRTARVVDFIKPMKSKRPRVPVVPTTDNVAALADSVRRGVRSLTDAVYDHPAVRQVDRTARGAYSAMDRLESGDFSIAVVDLIRAVGLEEQLRGVWGTFPEQVAKSYGATTAEQIRSSYIRRSYELRIVPAPPASPTEDDEEAQQHSAGEPEPNPAEEPGPHPAGEAFDRFVKGLDDVVGMDERLRATIEGHRDALEDLMVRLAETDPLELIEKGVDALESVGEVREVVAAVTRKVRHAADQAEDTVAEVAADVGAWYDSRMNALTGWYRRRSRFVSFLLALAVVFLFNVDAVRIPLELWSNETVRSTLVSIAENSDVEFEDCAQQEGPEAAECVEEKVDLLVESGLPLGWTLFTDCDGDCGFWERIRYNTGLNDNADGWLGEVRDVTAKLLGWILAAAAVSMGASFWFDVLRRAMGIRSAMKGEQAKS